MVLKTPYGFEINTDFSVASKICKLYSEM